MSTVFSNSPFPAASLIDEAEKEDAALSYSVSVNADRGRLFQVLTIAEYMEAWISVPGQAHGCPAHVLCDPGGFRISYYDEMHLPRTLMAVYQTFRTNKATFLWSRSGDLDSAARRRCGWPGT